MIAIIVSCTVGLAVCGTIAFICFRKSRRVGVGMTTTNEDGRVVQVSGGGKNMYKTDFEAKIGKRGFDSADKDGGGSISKKEWTVLFDEVDVNKDGFISRE